MAYEYRLSRRVEFSETDMAGIVHFSNYFRYMEMAEHSFFRSLGSSIHEGGMKARFGWPRIEVSCEYRQALRFEELFEVHLLVERRSSKTISYRFHIIKEDGSEAALGRITAVCVAFDPETGQMRAIPIPDEIAQKIDIAPPEAL